MGLAGNKNRTKLSHDPNNTTWSKSTTNFGHRILSKQGWKPGEYLGAENASHGDHYTAANASHIRVLLREDNLGLGAKIGGKANAETFGLSLLSSVFGRLNGKTEEEVEKKQADLRDAELRTFQAQKYGFLNFVRGGLLVGDKIEEIKDGKIQAKTVDAVSAGVDGEKKASKKRKVEDETKIEEVRLKKKQRKAEDGEASISLSKKAKKKHKSNAHSSESDSGDQTKDLVSAEVDEDAEDVTAAAEDDRGDDDDREAKRRRKEERKADRAARKVVGEDGLTEKARLRAEKRARKEERRKRKEEGRQSRALESGSASQDSTPATSVLPTPSLSELPSGLSTPSLEAAAFGGSRRAVRSRYIQQKRMASMDPRALNEILMIKAG